MKFQRLIFIFLICTFSCQKSHFNFANHSSHRDLLTSKHKTFNQAKLKQISEPLPTKKPSFKGVKERILGELSFHGVPEKTGIKEDSINKPPKRKRSRKRVEENIERGKKLGDLSLKVSSISALSGLLYLLLPSHWPLVFIWMFGSVVGFFLGWGALRKRRKNNLNAVIGLILGSGVILFFLLIGIFVLLYLTSGFGVTS